MRLVSPSLNFKSEFSDFYRDFAENDKDNSDFYITGYLNFSDYIQALKDEENIENPNDDSVPCSHYWLINNDDTIIGAIRIRHNIDSDFLSLEGGHIGYDIAPSFRGRGFGKLMLKLVLPKANKLGISEALIVADEDNIASRKIIEANGGEFEKAIIGEVVRKPLVRYWVPCNYPV
ncbi:MAG: GNAT family N-acetyltransferase [Acidiferrobacterales bacterium]|nr:GNAT family N-acetyltransferase [Acidiferrobacterales bacterium]